MLGATLCVVQYYRFWKMSCIHHYSIKQNRFIALKKSPVLHLVIPLLFSV